MKAISKLMLLLLVIFVSSCKNDNDSVDYLEQDIKGKDAPVTETTDDYSITFKYNDDVIVLDEAAQRYLQKVENDTVLYFASNTPRNILPQTGSIISSRVSDKNPYGLGNIVLSTTKENGMIKCVTTVAPLDDIFETLELESNFSLASLMKDKDGFYDADGNFYEAEIVDFGSENEGRSSRATVGSLEFMQLPLHIKEYIAYFDGNVAVGGILTFKKNNIAGTFENSLEIGIKLGGEVGFMTDENDKKVKKILDIIKKITVFQGVIAIGPVVLRPYVDFELALVGSGRASVGVNTYLSGKLGWTENGFFYENTSRKFTMEDFFKSLDFKGEVAVGLEPDFDLAMGLFTKNPSAKLGLYPSIMVKGELKTGAENDAKMALDIDADLKGGFYANIFNKKEISSDKVDLKFNLYDLEMRIFPELESLSIYETNYEPLTFNSDYTLKGGFFAKLLGASPSFKVKKDGMEIYHLATSQELNLADKTNLRFELTGLEKKTKYMGIPCFYIGDFCYEYDGKEFRSGDDRMDEVIPEDLRDQIEEYIPIYGGINPPNIEGTYLISPQILVHSELNYDYPGMHFIDNYFQFYDQDSIANTIQFSKKSDLGWGDGNGAFISGSGNNFTVFLSVTGESYGISDKLTYLISGTKTDDGIKNLIYTLVMVDKGNDPSNQLIPIGAYRVIRDEDGISGFAAWKSKPASIPSLKKNNGNKLLDAAATR